MYLDDSSPSGLEAPSLSSENHVDPSDQHAYEGAAATEEDEVEDGDYGEEPAAEEGDESDDDWMVGSDDEHDQEGS